MISTLLPVLLTLLPLVIIVCFFFYLIKNASSPEKVAADFINRNLISTTAREFFDQDKLTNFQSLVKSGKTIAAAKEYKEVMKASLTESRLAVKITKSMSK